MRLLQDTVESLVWPPGSIILFFLLGGLLVLTLRSRRRLIALLLCCAALGVYLPSTELVSGLLVRNLEDRHPGLDLHAVASAADFSVNTDAAVILVLGGGTVAGSPDGVGIAPDALTRLAGALLLHNRTDIPILVSGGIVHQRSDASRSEADLATQWLQTAGVKREKIITEAGSTTTAENARNSIYLLSGRSPLPAIFLVTSAYHMPRALFSFQDYPGRIIPVPVDYKAVRGEFIPQSMLPSLRHLHSSSKALRELVGLLWYAIRERSPTESPNA